MKPEVQKEVARQLDVLSSDENAVISSAEKKPTTCEECLKYDGKVYLESDLAKPALPIHPNCRCKYIDFYLRPSPNSPIKYSVTVRIDDSPGIGGIRISGIDDMLDKLEKQYKPGSLSELIISNHGGNEGFFPMGDGDDLRYITQKQVERLKKLLSPNAIVDIRMCYTVDGKDGNEQAQKLANKLSVKVRGYEGPVNPYGTRPSFVKPDSGRPKGYFQRIYPNHKPKIFTPEK